MLTSLRYQVAGSWLSLGKAQGEIVTLSGRNTPHQLRTTLEFVNSNPEVSGAPNSRAAHSWDSRRCLKSQGCPVDAQLQPPAEDRSPKGCDLRVQEGSRASHLTDYNANCGWQRRLEKTAMTPGGSPCIICTTGKKGWRLRVRGHLPNACSYLASSLASTRRADTQHPPFCSSSVPGK